MPCPFCDGFLLPQGELYDRAWRCDDCGRLHLEGSKVGYFEEYEHVLLAAHPHQPRISLNPRYGLAGKVDLRYVLEEPA